MDLHKNIGTFVKNYTATNNRLRELNGCGYFETVLIFFRRRTRYTDIGKYSKL